MPESKVNIIPCSASVDRHIVWETGQSTVGLLPANELTMSGDIKGQMLSQPSKCHLADSILPLLCASNTDPHESNYDLT